MKKVYNRDGKFYGVSHKIAQDGNNLIVTMKGDFPGMAEKNLVFPNGSIIYEDNDRIYIFGLLCNVIQTVDRFIKQCVLVKQIAACITRKTKFRKYYNSSVVG